jgi:hypothetical protein
MLPSVVIQSSELYIDKLEQSAAFSGHKYIALCHHGMLAVHVGIAPASDPHSVDFLEGGWPNAALSLLGRHGQVCS